MRILDATCSTRSMWFIKDCPFATYIDIRPEVKPDKVEDCRHTSFPAGEFSLIFASVSNVSIGSLLTLCFSSALFLVFGNMLPCHFYFF